MKINWLKILGAPVAWRRKELVKQLDAIGFYKYVPDDATKCESRAGFISSRNPFHDLFHKTGRLYGALYKEDQEPGWMMEVLSPIAPVLGSIGITLGDAITEERVGDCSTLRIGSRLWQVETESDSEEDRQIPERQLLLQALNELLTGVGSDERVWYTWGEKGECLYILLTPQQREVISDSKLLADAIEPEVIDTGPPPQRHRI